MTLKEFLKYINVWECVNIFIGQRSKCLVYNVSISNPKLIEYQDYYVDTICSHIENYDTDRPLTSSISIWITKTKPNKEQVWRK